MITPSQDDLDVRMRLMNKSLVLAGCDTPCMRVSYTTKLNFVERPTNANATPSQYLGILYATTAVKHTRQVLLYTLPQLLSAAGGTLGLYIGVSIFSMAAFGIDSIGYLADKLKFGK